VQRQVDGRWQTAFTDDGYQDTTERTGRDVWTETVQFTECDAVGRYRIRVDGVADKGDGPKPYRVTSTPFDVKAVKLAATTPVLTGDTVSVKGHYPAPAAGSLLAVPRLVTTGAARLLVTYHRTKTRVVTARFDSATGAFTADVGKASAVELLSLYDRCGNTT
jgi:hypothetical protein